MARRLDYKDFKILDILGEHADLTVRQISKMTMIPSTTVHNRIRRLKKRGVIKNFTVRVDHKKLGKDILAIVLINVSTALPSGEKVSQARVAEKIKQLQGVEDTYVTTGESDIVAKVRLASIDELNEFIEDKLRKIPGIEKTRTMIVLSVV